MKKAKFNLPVKFIIINFIILLAIIFIIGYIWNFIISSDYFKVKEIVVKDNSVSPTDFAYLKENNIFKINLDKESGYILEAFPNYSAIRLVRLLPNRILIDFLRRKAVAFLKLYKYFSIDAKGVLFVLDEPPEDSDLPVITGLETKIFGAKPGKRYNIKELNLALDILREIKNNKVLKIYKIKKIDVANPAEAYIFIPYTNRTLDNANQKDFQKLEGLEIKIGQDNIKDKISFLGTLILQSRRDIVNIKYIDLRFKEPVIKLRDATP